MTTYIIFESIIVEEVNQNCRPLIQ